MKPLKETADDILAAAAKKREQEEATHMAMVNKRLGETEAINQKHIAQVNKEAKDKKISDEEHEAAVRKRLKETKDINAKHLKEVEESEKAILAAQEHMASIHAKTKAGNAGITA